jgi:hypothetical protein
MDKFLSVLRTLRILESKSNRISLSNVAVIVVLIKMLVSPFDWSVAAGLLFSLLSYQSKKIINQKVKEPNDSENVLQSIKDELEKQKSQLTALSVQNGIKGLR